MSDAMATVRAGEVTVAVRDYNTTEHQVRRGQFIGLSSGEVRRSGDDCGDVVVGLVEDLGGGSADLVTLYYGEDVEAEAAASVVRRVKAAFPGVEIECYRGGQPHYHYLVSVE